MIPRREALAIAAQSVVAKIELLDQLGETIAALSFFASLITIEACSGKLIVSGMGKSGHIGRKLTATFQSTGQQSAFLHPAEALHGDMGMIGSGDALLLISNSGETEELSAIARYGTAAQIPTICITSQPGSSLARMADEVLAYPVRPEGDSIGKAPMASTCAQLAIGDALAAALMARRGFSVEAFGQLHHGGYLGRSIAPKR
jgi:arabinose-5-phosphate isomerase